MELIGPYLAACALLVLAGCIKARRPDGTARATASLLPAPPRPFVGLPMLKMVVRVLALLEACLGLVAMALPRPVFAALVAASYCAFAAFVAYARARGGALATCGCFGQPDTPATILHLVLDLALALAAAFVAASGPSAGSLVGLLARQPLHGAPLLAVTAVGVWLAFLALSWLPALQAAARLPQALSARRN